MSYVGSSAAAAELAEAASILQGTFITACCGAASGALVLYDHATTVSNETRFIWGRKFTCVTLLFHLNRWATFVLAMTYILGAVNWMTLQSCMPVGILQLAADVILYFIWSAFSGVRIYALTGGSWSLSIAVCALAAVPACLNLYNDAKTSFLLLPLPFVGTMCVSGSDLSQSKDLHLTIAARTCLIAADLTVLVVTWVKTYWTMKAARSSGSKAPLATMLLRDGTLYFLVLLILNVLHIAGAATNVFVYTTMFTTPISSIIVSHFLMNLREVASAPTTNGVQSTVPSFVRTQVSELRFASFVGNMGAPLDHSADTDSLEFGWEGESLETEVGSTEHEHGQWEKDVEMGQAGMEEGKGSGLEVLECQREGEEEALSH